MLNFNQIEKYVDAVKKLSVQPVLAQTILSLIDLTSLNDTDSQASISALCNQAMTSYGHVAAVCVYPQFVKHASTQLTGTPIKVATVANFPLAKDSILSVVQSITQSIENGAQEIDVVFPCPLYLSGDKTAAHAFIQTCKQVCGDKILLKVILETNQLHSYNLIAEVSHSALLAGADYIKTSTGKVGSGATLESAAVMLLSIKEMSKELNRPLGFKASGGIRTMEQAAQFIELANQILGPHWVSPRTFRLGASQLFENVLAILKKTSCPL